MKKIFLGLCVLVFLAGCKESGTETSSPCDGRQWGSVKEELDCRFPPPPIGRWHAVYTKEFAKAHSLPSENITTNLSTGVDYMEMDVLPYGVGSAGKACLVNMLVKKPHDIALFDLGDFGLQKLPEDRKLTHLIELDQNRDKLKGITTFNTASKDHSKRKGYRASTFAMYVEDVLPNYDYFSANLQCREVSLHPQYFPDGYAFWVTKASIWGRYETPYGDYDNPKTPKGKDFYNSHFFINVPKELVLNIFKNVPTGGR